MPSLLLVLTTAHAVTVEAVPNPRDDGRWVVDLADVVPAAVEKRLHDRIEGVHRDLGAEIAVVTVPDADAPSPKAFATALFNRWGIGDAEANNGLLVLLVMDQRRLEMETGYGLEPVLPDGWLGGMQAEVMVPAFRDGAFGIGLDAGVAATIDRMRDHPEQVREGTRGMTAIQRATATPLGRAASGAAPLFGALGGTVVIVGAGVWLARRQERQCPRCHEPMVALTEAVEDDHLSEGQQTEEAIGAVQHTVWFCGACDETKVTSSAAWFSGYDLCPSCGHRTLSETTRTIRAATYTRGGLEEVNGQCAHCGHRTSSRYGTPRRQRSTSSYSGSSGGGGGFSSGGGSFGGGSSGGGGAGSSW